MTTLKNPRIYLAGEPDSPLRSSSGRPVDIDEIRDTHNSSNLYVDPDFPAAPQSIGLIGGDDAAGSAKQGGAGSSYEWMRPHNIAKALGVNRPDFVKIQDSQSSNELFSEYDLTQGALGDCWYIAALQALTQNQDHLKNVIPEDNIAGFDDDKYCGAFHFRFFSLIDDKWVDVVVDDQLPVQKWEDSYRLAFAKASPKWSSVTVTEFWGPLIEKAYAKLLGSYARIEAGYSSQALENFTNGFAEVIDFTNPDTVYKLTSQRHLDIYDIMKRRIQVFIRKGTFMGIGNDDLMTAYQNGKLDGFSDYVDNVAEDGTLRHSVYGYKFDARRGRVMTDPSSTGLGLVCPHAYSIMDAREVARKDGSGTVFLLKLRNPHATHEWLGAFGEADNESWAKLEHDLRERNSAGSTAIDDGIFWMSLEDALKYFRSLEICAFGMDTNYAYVKGTWPASHQRVPITTHLGTCLQYCDAYKFEIRRELMDMGIPAEYKGKCMIAVTVVLGGYYSGMRPLPVFNYVLYKITEKDITTPGALQVLYSNQEYTDAGLFNIGRNCSRWTFLEPGTYIIVPYLLTELDASGNVPVPHEMVGKPVEYAIRLFTENETSLERIPGVEYHE